MLDIGLPGKVQRKLGEVFGKDGRAWRLNCERIAQSRNLLTSLDDL